ncbi:F-box/WD repeat-containing protein 7-like isoform X2 [Oncorhynchus tshawytscha]|uniref:Uncharacterized protein n=1 Tax=Oncorhynchus tshawytscha TaxID=74940 RepID=A0AAZ3RH74_ONCTS|nr:F-box/WD repeat-containing protein 7-like isoform X2 [Oncorhynchus tshawytscha]
MKQDPLTRGGNTGPPLPGRGDSMGVSLLGSTPPSSSISSISSLSSFISSSSSGEERRKGGGEEFIGREEGEVVSISIVTISEESWPSEPFGTVGGHVERKRKLDHGPDIRPFPSGKKHCKGSNYLSPSSFVPFQTTPTTFGDLRAANGHSAQRRRVTSGPPPSGLQDWLHTFQAWSAPERLLALDELIDTCESNQVKHMMQVIEPQFQRDFISLLPKEVLKSPWL